MDHLQQKKKWKTRLRKQLGVRRRLRAAGDHPRLSVYRSSKNISAQLIDDSLGKTLASASTLEAGLQAELKGKTKSEKAAIIGATVASRAKESGNDTVLFDRGRYLYHGRVKALAEAAREGGLKF